MCVMGSTNDRAYGVEFRPSSYAELRRIGRASGYSLQNNAPLDERVHASRQRASQHALAPQFIYPGIRPRTRGRAT